MKNIHTTNQYKSAFIVRAQHILHCFTLINHKALYCKVLLNKYFSHKISFKLGLFQNYTDTTEQFQSRVIRTLSGRSGGPRPEKF